MKKISALALLLGLFVSAVYFLIPDQTPPTPQTPFEHVGFDNIPGWKNDSQEEAFQSFQVSCETIVKFPDDRSFKSFGEARDWKNVCRKALEQTSLTNDEARSFFEKNFDVIYYKNEPDGLFTGYYAPLYKGSRIKGDKYNAPLYTIPGDLQAINLGDFDQSLSGRSIIGEVKDGKFVPYKDRKAIDQGALEGQNIELVWLEKLEETFFLQIQGSGFIELDDGEILHLGYAQRNGRPYRAIGQFLIQSGDIEREDMSLQAILEWMEQNPEKSKELMWKNPSYVFFQERDNDKPVGSLGVGLTPGRSLAVDREYIPLGMPLWLETYEEEIGTETETYRPNLKRLVIAQDTGGAIKGKIRGDVYWGIGQEAELKAGPMKDKGKYYMFVPKANPANNEANVASDVLEDNERMP